MIDCGPAHRHEYDHIRDIVARAFASPDEADLWDYLIAHDPDLTPDCVRVARRQGRIVACTVVLPRSLRAGAGMVRGAIVTLVACDPDYQGQGFGSASVRDALEYITATGCILGILYGHPTYYPRFGFVPVLARASTALDAGALSFDGFPPVRTVEASELPALLTLYARQLGMYPCAVARSADPWIWHPRNQAELVSCPGTGYALLSVRPDRGILYVREGCAEPGRVDDLLAALCGRARNADLSVVDLGVPPDHPLALRARELGAVTTITPPAAGMAIVLDWQPLLPSGYRIAGDRLLYLNRPVLQASRSLLTRIVLGAVDLDAPLAADMPEMLTDHHVPLGHDFPAGFPHWSEEAYWF